MNNNAILRSVRYMLVLSDSKMAEIVKLGGLAVTPAKMRCFLKKEQEEDYQECSNTVMMHFLNGFILFRRGKDDNFPPPTLETTLTNNIVLKKLRVAFGLKDTDMLEIFKRVDFRISKPEMSAIFRQSGHKNYRVCGDQILRNFLQGLTLSYRNPSLKP